jgi:hypothetical protein
MAGMIGAGSKLAMFDFALKWYQLYRECPLKN